MARDTSANSPTPDVKRDGWKGAVGSHEATYIFTFTILSKRIEAVSEIPSEAKYLSVLAIQILEQTFHVLKCVLWTSLSVKPNPEVMLVFYYERDSVHYLMSYDMPISTVSPLRLKYIFFSFIYRFIYKQ